MPHIILTKDVYLKKALSVILQQVPADRKLCIIDIESFRSLGAIFNILKRKLSTDNRQLIFIGGKNVSSRVLEPLVTLYRKSSFIDFRRQLISGRTYSLEYALNHIAGCRNLSMLTRKEKKAIFALLDTDDIQTAAVKINLSPKTIYTYTYKIGIKMNLCSILQLRQFIYSEFKLDKESLLDCSFPLKIKSSHSPLRSNPLITPIGLKSLHTMPHDCGIEIISCCSFA